MSYINTISGHEEEGFFDIVTGRPRYPFFLYNQTREQRVAARKDSFGGKKPGNIPAVFVKPEGTSHTVPGHKALLEKFSN